MTDLCQRDESNKKTVEGVHSLGRKARIVTAELSDPSAVAKIVPDLVAEGVDMHILLNCAGVQSRHDAHEFPMEDWDRVIQVNLNTVFNLCRDFGAYLLKKEPTKKGRRGNIINVGSLLCFQGGLRVPAYAAAKAGLAIMSKGLSNEWASKGINVNVIAPGYIDTEMNTALMNDEARQKAILERIPAGRWGQPEDFKGVAVFLASDASAYVSGEIVTVDGGWMGR